MHHPVHVGSFTTGGKGQLQINGKTVGYGPFRFHRMRVFY